MPGMCTTTIQSQFRFLDNGFFCFFCKCSSVSHRMNQSQYWLVSEKERKDSRPTVAKQMFIDNKKKSPFGSHTHTDKQTNGQTDKKLKGIHPFIHPSIDQIGSTDGWCHMAIGRIIIIIMSICVCSHDQK